MEWYFFALACTFLTAFGNVLTKKILFKERSIEFNVVGKFFQALIILFLIPFLSFNYAWWVYLGIYGISLLGVIYIIFETKSYRHMELSAVAPLGNLGPAFTLVLAFLILGETVNFLQGFGIFILALGAYILEAEHHWRDFKFVYRSLKNKFILYFFIGLFISTLAALWSKYYVNIGIDILTLTFWYYIFTFINFYLLNYFFFGGVKDFKHGIRNKGIAIFFVALFFVLNKLAFMKAITLANISLVVPIAHGGVLLSTIVGGKLFHEKHVWQRTMACFIMIFGGYLVIVG